MYQENVLTDIVYAKPTVAGQVVRWADQKIKADFFRSRYWIMVRTPGQAGCGDNRYSAIIPGGNKLPLAVSIYEIEFRKRLNSRNVFILYQLYEEEEEQSHFFNLMTDERIYDHQIVVLEKGVWREWDRITGKVKYD